MVKSQLTKNKGFTLIEILVALVIVAIAFFAIFLTASRSVRQFDIIQQKNYAEWVANNIMNEALLNMIAIPSSGQQQVFNSNFQWQIADEKTQFHQIKALTVTVSNHQTTLFQLTSYTHE